MHIAQYLVPLRHAKVILQLSNKAPPTTKPNIALIRRPGTVSTCLNAEFSGLVK